MLKSKKNFFQGKSKTDFFGAQADIASVKETPTKGGIYDQLRDCG